MARYFGSFVAAIAISSVVAVVCLGQRFAGLGNKPIVTIAFGVVGCAVAYGLAGLFYLRTAEQAV
jgi:hypothetical protein